MIDLHCHILPGVEEDETDPQTAMAMARIAVDDGINAVVATPAVHSLDDIDVPGFGHAVGSLNVELARAGTPLAVVPGAELALSVLASATADQLSALTLGGSRCILVESPFVAEAPDLESLLGEAQDRGFRPLLAHPERSPLFEADRARLESLVESGVLTLASSGSMTGRYGSKTARLVADLLRHGLIHAVGSNARDDRRRPPRLREAFDAVAGELPEVAAQADWYTREVPTAILGDRELPERPVPPGPRRSRLRRLLRRG